MEGPASASPGQGISLTGDHRRYRRVEVAWATTVQSIHRVQWPGEVVSFGPYGMKVRVETQGPGPSEGTVVRLGLAPPDGQAPLVIEGIVCRVDPDGLAITFINLSGQTFHRLKRIVNTLLENPA